MGLTQRGLAEEFKVTPGAIAHWEKGVRRIPGPVERLIEIYEQAFQARRVANEKA